MPPWRSRPSALGNAAVAAAYRVPDEARGSALQLTINLAAIMARGSSLPPVQRLWWRRVQPPTRPIPVAQALTRRPNQLAAGTRQRFTQTCRQYSVRTSGIDQVRRSGSRMGCTGDTSPAMRDDPVMARGQLRIYLGAAPGGWSQVAVERCGGGVLSIDLGRLPSLEGATNLELDILAPEAPEAVKAALGGKADIVLSDMAPAATGHRETDHLRSAALVARTFSTASTKILTKRATSATIKQPSRSPGRTITPGTTATISVSTQFNPYTNCW